MANPVIKYSDFDLNKLKVAAPEAGSYTKEGVTGKFQKCQYTYDHERNPDAKVRIETCKVKSSRIIKDKEKPKEGYPQKYFVRFEVPINAKSAEATQTRQVQTVNPETGEQEIIEEEVKRYNTQTSKEFAQFSDDFHLKLGGLHNPYRGNASNQIKAFYKTDDSATLNQTGFKHVINWEMDMINGVKDENVNPFKYCNVMYGFDKESGAVYRARFKRPSGEEVPWEVLENCEFDAYYVIHYRNSYFGGQAVSTQQTIVSGVITDIREIEYSDLQQETMDVINAEDPNASDHVRQQTEKMLAMLALRANKKGPSPVDSASPDHPGLPAPAERLALPAPTGQTPHPSMGQGQTQTQQPIQAQTPASTAPIQQTQSNVATPDLSSFMINMPTVQDLQTPLAPQTQPSSGSPSNNSPEMSSVPQTYAPPTNQYQVQTQAPVPTSVPTQVAPQMPVQTNPPVPQQTAQPQTGYAPAMPNVQNLQNPQYAQVTPQMPNEFPSIGQVTSP